MASIVNESYTVNKYEVLDDVGLTYKKTEIDKCLKLRYENTNSKCIITVEYLYCLISAKMNIFEYKIHIIHNTQYVILSDLLQLLSHVEVYLNLCIKRLLIEEDKVRLKLDELSTKKLRTKNTVKTSEELRLCKDLQRLVHDDLEGLREMREATFSTLDSIINDRVNTLDTGWTLKVIAHRIKKAFPSYTVCCVENGDHDEFIYHNIQYVSQLSLIMEDCHRFLEENDCLKQIIEKNNVLRRYQRNMTRKHSKDVDIEDDDKKVNIASNVLYFDNMEEKNGLKAKKNGMNKALKILDLTEAFKKIEARLSVTINDMNKNCSTLQKLFQLKKKMGKQLVEIVKFHWK